MAIQATIERVREENPFLNNQQLVYEVVLDEILRIQIKSGERINQSQLCGEFNLSRGPIHAAMEDLTSDGFLVRSKSGSYFVNQRNSRFSINTLSFKKQLDLMATVQGLYDVTADTLRVAKQCLSEMEERGEREDITGFCESDLAFHMAFVEATKNPLLVNTYQKYRRLFMFHEIMNFDFDSALMKRLVRVHWNIYHAVRTREDDAVRIAVERHYSGTWF